MSSELLIPLLIGGAGAAAASGAFGGGGEGFEAPAVTAPGSEAKTAAKVDTGSEAARRKRRRDASGLTRFKPPTLGIPGLTGVT